MKWGVNGGGRAPSFGEVERGQAGVRLTWLLGFHTCSKACWGDRQQQVRDPGPIPAPPQNPGRPLPGPKPF